MIAVVTCAWCATVVEGDQPPITWSSAVERTGVRHYCERCSREHLRAIEGKLDTEWWS